MKGIIVTLEKETPVSDKTIRAIAVTQALGGEATPLVFLKAHVDATGGEHRKEQEEMVEAVTKAIQEKTPLLVQAGTGTGKSLAYLFPMAVLGGRGVIATATNQLSEQLIRHDLPQVQKTMRRVNKDLSFALLKGRNNYACFSGEEQLLTKNGIKTFKELNGTSEWLCDGNGDWVLAEIKSFGIQRIMELEISRRNTKKIINTTSNHRWFVEINANYPKKVKEVITKELRPKDCLKFIYPKSLVRKGRNGAVRPSTWGIAHGLVFGDGTVFPKTANGFRTGTITLYGDKNKSLLKYFNESHYKIIDPGERYSDRIAYRICDIPNSFKKYPSMQEAPSYLYGWLAGYFGADGCVDDKGSAVLTSANRANLEFVSNLCILLGIGTGSIYGHTRLGKGKTPKPIYSLNLDIATLTNDFFIIEAHRKRVEARQQNRTYKQERTRRRWKVIEVRETERFEEVFCAIVPTTNSFILAGGILTGNCLEKINELESLERQSQSSGFAETQDMLFDLEPIENLNETKKKKAQAKEDSSKLIELMDWVKHTDSGDRSEAPPVPDRLWNQVSTASADCPGATVCPFGQTCFTERAREIAKHSDIIVTNHALLARDLNTSGNVLGTLFGPHDSIVIDEAHSFTSTLISSLSRELDPRSISKFLTRAAKHLGAEAIGKNSKESPIISGARDDLEKLQEEMIKIPIGPLVELSPNMENLLIILTTRLLSIHKLLVEEAKLVTKTDKVKKAIALQIIVDQAVKIADAVSSSRTVGDEQVRWVEKDRRDNTPVLYIAPITVGDFLKEALGERTLIGTSATLTVGGSFNPIAHTLGLDEEGALATTLDVGSPFDYPNQGMLYIPESPFPEPVGKDRLEHTNAVLKELATLVKAAGGRTLALFTTTTGAVNAAQYLRNEFPGLSVHAHGEASADSLVKQFTEEETSVLCVTMGLWQGVSVEGASCSLVVIDKIAFAPVDDVLTAARRAYVDKKGRNGFNEVIVGQAATSLAQGSGRLIRTSSDKGVVAILDPRLLTKGYGKILLESLPDFKKFSNLETVTSALERLTGGMHPEAFETFVSKPKNKTASSAKTKAKVARRASGTRNIGKSSH